jgi:hypothetical protein
MGIGNPTISYSFESLSVGPQWHNIYIYIYIYIFIGLNFQQSQPGIDIVCLSVCLSLSHTVKYVTAKDVPYTTHKIKPPPTCRTRHKTTIILLYSPHISPNDIKLNTLSLSLSSFLIYIYIYIFSVLLQNSAFRLYGFAFCLKHQKDKNFLCSEKN